LEEDTLLDDVADSIGARYFQTPGSVTAALRKAIIETNNQLLDYNLNGSDRMREGALTCVVQKNNELYVAQVGEAIALVGHNFGIERLPADRVDMITPLGRSAGLDIRYHHNWLQSGDMFLLPDPRLTHLTTEVLEPVLVNGDIEDGTEELVRLIGSDSNRLMLIEFTNEAPAYLPDAIPDVAVASTGRRLPPPTTQPVRGHIRSAPPISRKTRANLAQVDVEVVETSARRATSTAAKGLARFTAGLADFLTRLRPPRKETHEQAGWAMPMFLAVGIPLTIAAVVAGVYFQRGSVVAISDLRSAMRTNLDLARQASDDQTAKMAYYNQVLKLAAEGEELRPDDSEIVSIRNQALADLDNMEGVGRLNAILLHEYPDGSDLTSVALGDNLNGGIYTLDSNENQVFLQETDENYFGIEDYTPEVILSASQPVGNQIVGDLLDMMWRPRGSDVSRDGVAMLDQGGTLFSYYPNLADTRAVPLGFAIDWVRPTAITNYFERLYVLDAGSQEIWKYLPEGDGFILQEDERSIEFDEDVDLAHVVDFAIHSEDGSVLLLYDDGRIRRYVNRRMLWDESSLLDSGLNVPLVSPTDMKLVGRGLSSSIFVLDPGSDRLVQISLGGTFLAQFKIADENGVELLRRASDIEVATDPFRVFVVAGNDLYQASKQ
jgi:hypothetical protein